VSARNKFGKKEKNGLISYYGLVDLVDQGVIEGVAEDHINAASIDITLGAKLLIEDRTDGYKYKGHPDVVSLRNRDSLKVIEWNLISQGPYVLKPGEFILAHSCEVFNLPDNIAAEYKLKSSLARVGLDHLNAGWCLCGDTTIPLLNGTTQPIESLVGKSFWTYSIDENSKVVPGFVSSVFISKYVSEVMEIILDSGESFRCTPEHRIMLRDGSYKEAKDLLVGQSLMPLYRKINQGKEWFLDPSFTTKKVWIHTHRMVYETLNGVPSKHSVVHHVDHNPINNDPTNLVCMDRWIHIAQHNTIRNQSENQRKIASKTMAATNKKLWQDEGFRERQEIKNRELAKKLNEKQWNHSIKAISEVHYTDPVPVYDMTVEGYHNFALGCGIFVHNCDPGWHGSTLTLELRNLTTYHFLKLEFGIKIGQMVFFRCDPVPQEASYAARGSYNNNTSVQGALPEEGVTEPKGAARALSSPTVVGKALDILFQNSTKEDLFKSVMTKKSEGDTDEHY